MLPPAGEVQLTPDSVASWVVEFYNTSEPARRKELNDFLEQLKREAYGWRVGMELLNSNYPPQVQFYGVSAMYESVSTHFTEISEDQTQTDLIKEFLLHNLTSGVNVWRHSVLNKLFSTLAVFSLKCVPDIWQEPFADLLRLWAAEPELLLRVLAEVAAEFPRLSVPLGQRSLLKKELLKMSEQIVRVTYDALADSESSPSLKNAAAECVELWLKLPGIQLTTFLPAVEIVFTNISNDLIALARMVTILNANEELENLPRLVAEISQFLAVNACPLILERINLAISHTNDSGDQDVEEIVGLLSALVEFLAKHVHNLVIESARCIHAAEQNALHVYTNLCKFFLCVSSIEGLYPVDECFSDLPELFWSSLKDSLIMAEENKPYYNNKKQLLRDSSTFFLQTLQSAIAKIAYFNGIEQKCVKAEMEQFDAYRLSRSDASVNAICVDSGAATNLLVNCLSEFLEAKDIYRAESVLYYMKEAANYLSEPEFAIIAPVLCHCAHVPSWQGTSHDAFCRFGLTLTQLLHEVEHLVLTHEKVGDVLPVYISMLVAYLSIESVAGSTLETLTSFLKAKDPVIETVVDNVIKECYAYFADHSHPETQRLDAIRCVGLGLSFKEVDVVLHSLDQILSPRLLPLNHYFTESTNLTSRRHEATVLFELGVVSRFVATLDSKKTEVTQETKSPVKLIIDQCLPLFDAILSNSASSSELVTKVCDVLKAGIISLYTAIGPVLSNYLSYIDGLHQRYPEPMIELAKAIFLTFRQNDEVAPVLIRHLAKWFVEEARRISASEQCVVGEVEEKMLDLAYHITKKNWQMFTTTADAISNVQVFLRALCDISVKVIRHCLDVAILRDAFRVLGIVVKNCAISDKPHLRQCLIEGGESVISTSYSCIGTEHVSRCIDNIAEILFYYAQTFPAETRQVVSKCEGADSALTRAMFDQNLSFKNFRLRISQIHQAAMKRK